MEIKNLHPLQMHILKMITCLHSATFGQLRPKEVSTDQFNYHLQTLVDNGLLQTQLSASKKKSPVKTTKIQKKYYSLTREGKQFIERLETDLAKILTQGKRSALFCAWRKRGNGEKEYLVHQRTKEPHYGLIGFAGGKIREQETVSQAVTRELKEETGLHGPPKLRQILHYIDYDKDNNFLRDVYFWAFEFKNPEGTLLVEPEGEGVRNFWATKTELQKGGYEFFPGFWEDIFIWNRKLPFFSEKIRSVKHY